MSSIQEHIDKARIRSKEWVDKNYPPEECEENIRRIARSAYFTALLDHINGLFKL